MSWTDYIPLIMSFLTFLLPVFAATKAFQSERAKLGVTQNAVRKFPYAVEEEVKSVLKLEDIQWFSEVTTPFDIFFELFPEPVDQTPPLDLLIPEVYIPPSPQQQRIDAPKLYKAAVSKPVEWVSSGAYKTDSGMYKIGPFIPVSQGDGIKGPDGAKGPSLWDLGEMDIAESNEILNSRIKEVIDFKGELSKVRDHTDKFLKEMKQNHNQLYPSVLPYEN